MSKQKLASKVRDYRARSKAARLKAEADKAAEEKAKKAQRAIEKEEHEKAQEEAHSLPWNFTFFHAVQTSDHAIMRPVLRSNHIWRVQL